MIKKRFTINTYSAYDTTTFMEGGKEYSSIEVVDLLNEQHEQIEDLKDANVRCCNEYSYFHKRMMELQKENEQLKEALREELQDNGNTYYIEIFDKLFNLNYDEWNKNERYRECIDWEKILKEKGDVE